MDWHDKQEYWISCSSEDRWNSVENSLSNVEEAITDQPTDDSVNSVQQKVKTCWNDWNARSLFVGRLLWSFTKHEIMQNKNDIFSLIVSFLFVGWAIGFDTS